MLTVFLITAVTAIFLAVFYSKRAKLPPGPVPLPLIGNLHQVGWLSIKQGGIVNAMKELKKVYGPVFTIWMGPQPTVHVCSLDLAQETMIKRGGEFVDRWMPHIFNELPKGKGIIMSNGSHWVEQRRFALHTLRNFGLGRGIMEERIMMELDKRTQLIDDQLRSGKDEIYTPSFVELTVGSIINRLLFNERFEKHLEEEFFALKHRMDEVIATYGVIDTILDSPIVRNLPLLRNRWDKMVQVQLDVKAFIGRQVTERMRNIEKGDHVIDDEPKDYVDAFLIKMKEESSNSDSTYNFESLLINLLDLWQAGQETTSNTLMCGFYQLLTNPDVITKVRKEILTVTKGERHLSLQDKASTPYLIAVITEIQRFASVVNINLFRRVREDTVVGGHLVYGGTPITAEISVLMNEDGLFEEPQKFNPSRYFKNEKLDQHVLPFGLGKRSCPGESLARAELYLIIGNMIQRYDLKPPTSEPLKGKEAKATFFNVPPRYKMKLTKL